MNGLLYLPGKEKPVSVLDHLEIVSFNDNHTGSPKRIFFRTRQLTAGKKMVELFRDEKMTLELNDGRSCNVLMQHTCIDAKGEFVGVLRVLDELAAS